METDCSDTPLRGAASVTDCSPRNTDSTIRSFDGLAIAAPLVRTKPRPGQETMTGQLQPRTTPKMSSAQPLSAYAGRSL